MKRWGLWNKSASEFAEVETFKVRSFDGLQPVEIARQLVGRSVAVRKSDQSMNFPLLLVAVFFLVGVPYVWVYSMNTVLTGQAERSAYRSTAVAQGTFLPVGEYGVSNPMPSLPAFVSPSSTPVPFEVVIVMASPVPSATPSPTPVYPRYTVGYSYYNPDLGGVNCHSANWNGVTCADTTASGISWRDYMRKGVAIPPSWYDAGLGYGSIIRVIDPSAIAGEYVVIDLCSGCEAFYWDDKMWRLDFLDTVQRLQWAYPVTIELIAVVPPPPSPTPSVTGAP